MTERTNPLPFDLLLSFAYYSKFDLAACRRQIGDESLLIIDSGAFTAHTTGKQVNLDDYAAYLKHWSGQYSAAMTLDVINDPKATRKNTRKLHDMGLPVLPIFTPGDSIKEFDAMCRDNPYVAVGGVAALGRDARSLRKNYCRSLIDRAGDTKLHLLGVGGETAWRLKPYSSDSSLVLRNLMGGRAVVFDGRTLIFGRVKAGQRLDPVEARLFKEYQIDVPRDRDREWVRASSFNRTVAGIVAFQLFAKALRRDADRPHLVMVTPNGPLFDRILEAWPTAFVPNKYLPKERVTT